MLFRLCSLLVAVLAIFVGLLASGTLKKLGTNMYIYMYIYIYMYMYIYIYKYIYDYLYMYVYIMMQSFLILISFLSSFISLPSTFKGFFQFLIKLDPNLIGTAPTFLTEQQLENAFKFSDIPDLTGHVSLVTGMMLMYIFCACDKYIYIIMYIYKYM